MSITTGAGRFILGLSGCGLLFPFAMRADAPRASDALRVVIVGSGPNPEYNQVAIESNVRYVSKLLPASAIRTTLFADGNADNATVLYEEDARQKPVGERLLGLLLQERNARDANPLHYKKPNLGVKLDGPNRKRTFTRLCSQVAQEPMENPPRPLLLYFTGHGSNNDKDGENNFFDMWNNEQMSVREFAVGLERVPDEVPVSVVMVSCHSGAFANLIFEGGDPNRGVIKRDIAGFFAAIKERPAAGCTSEVNEEEYRDFTSYFFAALTGRDRLNRKVTGADYNKDGRVGMDEAYCYTLANDRSIDVPVCTSDVFLRKFVTMDENDVFKPGYSEIRSWATPGQRAALDALATQLKRTSGEDRLAVAFRDMRQGLQSGSGNSREYQAAVKRFRAARREGQKRLYRRWPELEGAKSAAKTKAIAEAKQTLEREAGEGQWKELLESDDAMYRTDSDDESHEIAESHLLRFVRLGKSIVLAHRLQTGKDAALKARYARLVTAEGRTVLPPVTGESGSAER